MQAITQCTTTTSAMQKGKTASIPISLDEMVSADHLRQTDEMSLNESEKQAAAEMRNNQRQDSQQKKIDNNITYWNQKTKKDEALGQLLIKKRIKQKLHAIKTGEPTE